MKKQFLHFKLNLLGVLLPALFFFFASSTASGQNLVTNGSFETATPIVPTTGPTEYWEVDLAQTVVANWTYVSGEIDLHHSRHHTMGCPVGGGNQHLDLNPNGVITQNITGLVDGRDYSFSFSTSVHALLFGGTANATVQISGGMLNRNLSLGVADKPWARRSYTFTAVGTTATLTFSGTSSIYSAGGILIDLVDIHQINCDEVCQDEDWFEIGTTSAPTTNTAHMYRIGNAGIGTTSPTWNFKLTVDNRDGLAGFNNNRNAIHAIAMHTECSFGYGIMVNTNPVAATKALAVQGNGTDRALIFGNGMSWFGNKMTIGGALPGDVCFDNPLLPSSTVLVINGTGTINGMNITSDSRFKTDIKSLEDTRDIIRKLNPVTYSYKKEEFAQRNFPAGPVYGFIAQELKEVLPYAVNQEPDGYYSVNYISIIPVLTQALKEQQTKIEELEAKVEAINEVNKLKDNDDVTNPTQKVELNKGAALFQNSPNPLNNFTFIDYYLPPTTASAFIRVVDNAGRLVKAFPIKSPGYGQVEVECTNITDGVYYYSLVADNVLIDTKTMVVAKN